MFATCSPAEAVYDIVRSTCDLRSSLIHLVSNSTVDPARFVDHLAVLVLGLA